MVEQPPPQAEDRLLPQHAELIAASAIAPEVAAARGYFSARRKRELEEIGFGVAQRQVPALVVPVHSVYGSIALHQIRPDHPRILNGKGLKYETPRGARMVLDVPPGARPKLGNPSVPLFITEGARKADAAVSQGLCCVALLGVWNFRGSNEYGGKTALPCWDHIALNGRIVFICFDSDVMQKSEVARALGRLGQMLKSRDAQVHYCYLPPGLQGEKVGLDDFFAAGNTVEELINCATTQLRSGSGQAHPTGYRMEGGRTYFDKPTKEGPVPVALANFEARIVAEEIRDDGTDDLSMRFQITGVLEDGRALPELRVAAASFQGLGWVLEWGSRAIISAGVALRDHLRCAIQSLSEDPERRRVFTHTGWREIDGRMLYLHGGGAIGAEGAVQDVVVDLPGVLGSFILPDPPHGDALAGAVRASQAMLDVAPLRVTAPLHAAVYRAVLGNADYAIFAAGPTGVFKSELAALAQQHWGGGLDARHLPGSWASTGNSLEAVAFSAKDALFVVDDFAPHGTQIDVARMHKEADRLLRAQGNRAGRARLNARAELRAAKPPRGLILSTGEDIPRGESLRSRLVVVEVAPRDVNLGRLTEAQADAAAGRYASALAGFLRWAASRLPELRAVLADGVLDFRTRCVAQGIHPRTPGALGELVAAEKIFLRFAVEIAAISEAEARVRGAAVEMALMELARAQVAHVHAEDPVRRFSDLLRGALVAGEAYVATASGDGDADHAPEEDAARWGWRVEWIGSGENEKRVERPLGKKIGWLRGDDLYLDPDASYRVVQAFAAGQGAALPIGQRTLWKRLAQDEYLLSHDPGHYTVKVRIGNGRPRVLHVSASFPAEGPAPDGPASRPRSGPAIGSERGHDQAENWASERKNASAPVPGPCGPAGPASGDTHLHQKSVPDGQASPDCTGAESSNTDGGACVAGTGAAGASGADGVCEASIEPGAVSGGPDSAAEASESGAAERGQDTDQAREVLDL